MSSVRRCVCESRPQREWRFYIDDMIGFAEKVLSAMRHKFGGHVEPPAGG